MALLHVKDLLDSLRSPETVVDLIRRAKEMTDELPTWADALSEMRLTSSDNLLEIHLIQCSHF